MTMRRKAWLSWSSGKDSAWALETIRRQGEVDVAALLTTFNATHGRVAMHAVREELVRQQAESVGLPVVSIPLPWPCPNSAYEEAMARAVACAQDQGVAHIAFGDLFLEDVRRYREEKLAGTRITPLFPLWGMETSSLAQEMIDGGLKAYLTCVDPNKLDRGFAGRLFDESLLAALPPLIDPCGENGEFHTFCFEGPMFRKPIPIIAGEILERDGFVFADLLPATSNVHS